MDRKHNHAIVPFAQKLRTNMTKEERHLWYDFLKSYPARFQRQKILGRYIADFYCAQAKLIIELDGSQHYSEEGLVSDAERSTYLKAYGISVIRIPNTDVMQNFAGVCEYIDRIVKKQIGGSLL